MQGYIGYIRVSTVKQGTKGVSLQEQHSAILRYAERNGLAITFWLEEMVTAAKQGRPIFNQALKLLRAGKAQGIILHKLDRGARNLRDWASIGELSDQGIEVHFVTESLDLQSRGGRLSADIQAVVAADYIRNLREETRKGFYGRLKQGLYPLGAPIGYLDQGKGKVKTIDPMRGPLIKRAFEAYATGRYNLKTLADELYAMGLRNRRGKRITINRLSYILNNPFYTGIIQLRKTGEVFEGLHKSIIGKLLFERVQKVLTGKINARNECHAFPYRRLLSCATCPYSLIGERQKGRVYYRCHSEQCHGTSIREDLVEAEVTALYERLWFNETELKYFQAQILKLRESWKSQRGEIGNSLTLQLGQIKDRLNRLMDAYLDEDLDKEMFEERKKTLLLDKRAIEENIANWECNSQPQENKVEKYLELASNARLSHEIALPDEKREMLQIFTSNRVVSGKKLTIEPSIPFRMIADRSKYTSCLFERGTPRTLDKILDHLIRLNEAGALPDLDPSLGCQSKDTKKEISMER